MPSRALPSPPKQARAVATRQRLLDAAVAELLDHGYVGLTTPGVAGRAHVSRGASQNYFPTKVTLVAEAVRHLATLQIDELHARVASIPRGRTRTQAALDVLFELYGGPLFSAIIELSLAARGEPELRTVIAAEERSVAKAINHTAAEIFGEEIAGTRSFAERWAMSLNAIRGLALLQLLGHPERQVSTQWIANRRELVGMLSRRS